MPEMPLSTGYRAGVQYIRQVGNDDVAVHVEGGIRKFRLQFLPRAVPDYDAVEKMTGITLPPGPGEKLNRDTTVYWLAPNDWLLLEPVMASAELEKSLTGACGDTLYAVTDVSDAYVVMKLSGSGTIECLAEGCSVDFEAPQFTAGHYVLTRLQNAAVIVHKLDESPVFRILVERSVAEYLCAWLTFDARDSGKRSL